MKSHAAGQNNKTRHLSKVHVHPFGIKPFAFNYHCVSWLVQKHELSSHGLEGCLCVCVYWCVRGGVGSSTEMRPSWKHVAPLSPKPYVASQSTCQSAVIAGRANGMGQRRDYKAAWCFHWGLPCWATWSQLPLSTVNPLNPVEEPIQKCVTHPRGAFCVE